ADGVAAVREAVRTATAGGDGGGVPREHRLDDRAGECGVDGLPPRTLALDASGRVLADGPTAEVLARHGATLREAGCWLPHEVEQRLAQETALVAAPDAEPAPVPAPMPGTRPAAPAEPLLTVCGADLGHEERAVLTEVDLTVRAGRMLAVVGRN